MLVGQAGQFGIFAQKIVQTAVHVQARGQGRRHVGASLGGQPPAVRSQAHHEVGGSAAGGLGQGQRRGQVGHDGNARWRLPSST